MNSSVIKYVRIDVNWRDNVFLKWKKLNPETCRLWVNTDVAFVSLLPGLILKVAWTLIIIKINLCKRQYNISAAGEENEMQSEELQYLYFSNPQE